MTPASIRPRSKSGSITRSSGKPSTQSCPSGTRAASTLPNQPKTDGRLARGGGDPGRRGADLRRAGSDGVSVDPESAVAEGQRWRELRPVIGGVGRCARVIEDEIATAEADDQHRDRASDLVA